MSHRNQGSSSESASSESQSKRAKAKRGAQRKLGAAVQTIFEQLERRTLLSVSAGNLDANFNSVGKVITDLGGSEDMGNATTIVTNNPNPLANGDIVVGGVSNGDFAVALYSSGGSLLASTTTAIGSGYSQANAVTMDSNGNIVLAGYTVNAVSNDDVAVARYKIVSSGGGLAVQLDTSFDTVGVEPGVVTTDIGGSKKADVANAVAIDGSGNIIVAGQSGTHALIASYSNAGVLNWDTLSAGKDVANGVIVETGGNILAVGHNATHAETIVLSGAGVIAQTNTLNLGTNDNLTSIAAGPNSEYIVGGTANGGFVVAEVVAGGTLDSSFGTSGETTTSFGAGSTGSQANSVAISDVNGNEKIYLAGMETVSASGQDFFALARYGANGTIDTAFGTGGIATTDFTVSGSAANSDAAGSAITPDGKLIVAGTTDASATGNTNSTLDNFAVASYVSNNAPTSASMTAVLASIDEDSSGAPGTSVGTLVAGFGMADPDGDHVGLAVTGVEDTYGTWQYSSDGSNWFNITGVSDSNALTLAPTSLIRFVPKTGNTGTSTISVRAWDQTKGSDGTFSDVTTNAAANYNSFSDDTYTASIYVMPPTPPPVVYVNSAWAGDATGTSVVDGFGQHTLGSDAFATIQGGVNAVASGGTVEVDGGLYSENVVVNNPGITITGPNASYNPNSDAEPTTNLQAIVEPGVGSNASDADTSSVFEVTASNVTIEGLTIQGSNSALTGGFVLPTGVTVYAAAGVSNAGNVANQVNGSLSSVTDISGLVVQNNIVKDFKWVGIDGDTSDGAASGNNIITDNNVSDVNWDNPAYAGEGIQAYDNFYAEISDNVLSSVRTGIQVGNYSLADPGTAPATISDNTVDAFFRGIYDNLQYESATGYSVVGNTISFDSADLPVGYDSTLSTPTNQYNNYNVGLLIQSLQTSVSATISGNDISGFLYGAELWNLPTSSTVTLAGGTLSGNTYGVYVTNDDPRFGAANPETVNISGVTIQNSTDAGVYVQDGLSDVAVAATIEGSTSISGGGTGILVSGADASLGFAGALVSLSSLGGNYITLADGAMNSGAANFTPSVLDASNVKFDGTLGSALSLTSAYGVEDKITDYLDDSTLGYVSLNANDVYVTQLSDTTNNGAIQRGINVAPSGGTVNVQAGVFVGEVDIETSLTLSGAQVGADPNTAAPLMSAQTIIEPDTSDPNPYDDSDVIMVYVGKSGVTIDGVTVDGSNNITPHFTHYVDPTADTEVIFNSVPIDAAEGIVSYSGVGNITVQNDIIENTAYTGVDFYNYDNGGTATSNNTITNNLIQNLSDFYGFGVGVLLYNNFYAQVTDNVIQNVTVGVQTGNFSNANNVSLFSPEISSNTISASGVGIFYNLMYDSSSAFTVASNNITAINAPADAPWVGILITSLQIDVSATFQDNIIDGTDAYDNSGASPSVGYELWNDPTTGQILITGGTVSGVDYGVWANSYEGYGPGDGDAVSATVSDVNITASKTGVYVEDSAANSNHPDVSLTINDGTQIAIAGGSGTGIYVSGSNASATISDVAVTDPTVGIEISGGTATISGNTITDNTTGIEFTNGGSGSITDNIFSGGTDNGTDLDIESSAGAVTDGGGNSFAAAQYINDYASADTLVATGDTFNGTAASSLSLTAAFGVEDRISDYLDNATYGYVELNVSEVYVAQSSDLPVDGGSAGSVQRGINVAPATGGTVNLQAGTYVANGDTTVSGSAVGAAEQEVALLNINKSVTLLGPNASFAPSSSATLPTNAQAIIVPGSSDSNPYDTSAIILVLVNASNVSIEGVTVDGINSNLGSHYSDPGTDTFGYGPTNPHTGPVTANSSNAIDVSEDIASYANVGDITIQGDLVENAGFIGVDFNNGTDYGGGATTGNTITDNLIQNISDAYGYGDGINLYDNFYASVTHNVLSNVYAGVQVGNFSQANPSDPAFASISNNQINAGTVGIFYNLSYDASTAFAVTGNTITAVNNPLYTSWDGVLAATSSPLSVNFLDNTVDGSGANAATQTIGYDVWNAPNVSVTGGTVSGVQDGVWANSYEGFQSPAGPTGVTVSGVNITASQIGVYVEDSALNTGHPSVSATIENGTQITTGGTGVGVEVSGANASASITGSTIDDPTIGVDVIGGSATISGNNIYNNTTGIEFTGGGNGSLTGNNFAGATDNGTDLLIASGAGTVSIGDGNSFYATGNYIDNESSQAFDLSGDTSTTFGGFNAATTPVTGGNLSTFYGIEDQIVDYLDQPSSGYVRIASGYDFVTQKSENTTADAIQRGVNVANVNDIIDVQSGNYVGDVAISTPLTLNGTGSPNLTAPTTASDAAIISVAAANVTIEGFDITVDQPHAAAGIAAVSGASGANVFDGLQILNNVITTTGSGGALNTPFGTTYSVGIAALANGSGTAPTVTIEGNSVLSNPGSFIKRAVWINEAQGTLGGATPALGNTLAGDYEDALIAFSRGAMSVQNNAFDGVGVTITEPNANAPTTISNNTFDSAFGGVDDASLEIKHNYNASSPVLISNNIFTVSPNSIGVLSAASIGVSVAGNNFAPASGATGTVDIDVDTMIPSGSQPVASTLYPNSISITGNIFSAGGSTTATAIQIANHDAGAITPDFGTITIGGAGALANTFDKNLANFIVEAPPTTSVSFSGDGYSGGAVHAGNVPVNIDASQNNFGVTSGDTLGSYTLADYYAIEDKIVDGIDYLGAGLVSINPGVVYVTPNSYLAPAADDTDSIQRAVDLATSGNTVDVEAGTYVDSSGNDSVLNIDNSVSVIGTSGAASTIIDGNSATEDYYVVFISSSNATLSGFTITNAAYDGTADASGVVVESEVNDSPLTNVTVSNNIIHDIGPLTRAASPGGTLTMGINVEGEQPGSGVTDSNFNDNTIYNIGNVDSNGFAIGILTAGDVGQEVNNDNIDGNTIYNVSNPGLAAGIDAGYGSENISISGNTIGVDTHGDAAPVPIGIRTSTGEFGPVSVTSNIISNATVAGISLNSPFSETVEGNNVTTAGIGLDITNGNVLAQSNTLVGNGEGVVISGGATVDLGTDLTADPGHADFSGIGSSSIGHNILTGYIGGTGHYAIDDENTVSGSEPNVLAEDNNFGPYPVSDPSVLANVIYDQANNPAQTIVYYVPALDAMPPAQTVYVNGAWSGSTLGTDPGGLGAGNTYGYDEFGDIQSAINAVATNGNVIIDNGSYDPSNILINKPVTIEGQSESGVVITPSLTDSHDDSSFGGTASNGFIIASSGVTIEDLTLNGGAGQNFRDGIITNSQNDGNTYSDIDINNVTVENVFRKGIAIYNESGIATGDVIEDNTLSNIGTIINDSGGAYEATAAIAVFGSDATIEGNVITNSAGGIEANTFDGSAQLLTVSGNQISLPQTVLAKGALGIDVASLAAGSAVSDNTVNLTGGTGNDIGIVMSFDHGAVTISGNGITGVGGDDGILLYDNATSVAVGDNTISGSSTGAGILVTAQASDTGRFGDGAGPVSATLTGNMISGYTNGVEVASDGGLGDTASANIGDGTTGGSNSITGAAVGVLVTGAGASDEMPKESLTGDTIAVEAADGGSVTISQGSTISSTGTGVVVGTGSSADINGSAVVDDPQDGITSDGDLTVENNSSIGGNANYGIQITGGTAIIENSSVGSSTTGVAGNGVGIEISGGNVSVHTNNMVGNHKDVMEISSGSLTVDQGSSISVATGFDGINATGGTVDVTGATTVITSAGGASNTTGIQVSGTAQVTVDGGVTISDLSTGVLASAGTATIGDTTNGGDIFTDNVVAGDVNNDGMMDLADNTITGTSGQTGIEDTSTATLTSTGDSISGSSGNLLADAITVGSGATADVNSAIIEYAAFGVDVASGGAADIQGSTVSYNGIGVRSSGTLTIVNGVCKSSSYAASSIGVQENAGTAIIETSTINNYSDGIQVNGGSATISGNTMSGNGTAIDLTGSSVSGLSDNSITGGATQIGVDDESTGTLTSTGDSISGASGNLLADGLIVGSGDTADFRSATVEYGTIGAQVDFGGTLDFESSTVLFNATGVQTSGTLTFNLNQTDFTSYAPSAIAVQVNGGSANIENSLINDTGHSIQIEGGSATITNNDMTGNGTAVDVENAATAGLSGNTISGGQTGLDDNSTGAVTSTGDSMSGSQGADTTVEVRVQRGSVSLSADELGFTVTGIDDDGTVHISDTTISNTTTGVSAEADASTVSISDGSEIESSTTGLVVAGGTVTVDASTITGGTTGVLVDASQTATIQDGSTISDAATGIDNEGGTVNVDNSTISGDIDGVKNDSETGISSIALVNSAISNNATGITFTGIDASATLDATSTINLPTDGVGVYFDAASGMDSITGGTISDSMGATNTVGIVAGGSGHSYISRVSLLKPTTAVEVTGVATLTYDSITQNNIGVVVESTGDAIIGTGGFGNDISDNITDGIDFTAGSTGTVNNNFIQGNGTGVLIAGGAGTVGPINDNSISGNTSSGVENDSTQTIDATANWWGSATGPTVSSNTGGSGDAILGSNVLYSPWLTSGTDSDAIRTDGFQPNSGAAVQISGSSSVFEGNTYTLSLNPSNPGSPDITGWVINWGDGSISNPDTQTVSGDPATVTHVFDEGSFTISATATTTSGPATSNDVGVTVLDAPLTDTTSVNAYNAIEGVSTGSQVLATFSDGNPLAPLSDYTPIVTWGGTLLAAPTVSVQLVSRTATASNWEVLGNADYATDGTYNVSVTVNDAGGSTVSSSGKTTFDVADAIPTVALTGSFSDNTNTTPNVAEGSTFTLTLAPVVDTGYAGGDRVEDYFINWGDGSAEQEIPVSTIPQLSGGTVTHVYESGDSSSVVPKGTTTPNAPILVDLLTTDNYFANVGYNSQSLAPGLGVVVYDVAPIASFSGSSTVQEGNTGSVTFFSQSDPGTLTQYFYSYDFSDSGNFSAPGDIVNSSSASVTVPASFLSTPGVVTVRGRISDQFGGFTDYLHQITVTNVAPSVAALSNVNTTSGTAWTENGSFTDPGSDSPWLVYVNYDAVNHPGLGTLVQSGSNKTFTLGTTYASTGTYTVQVTVEDLNDGAMSLSGTGSFTVNVTPSTFHVTNFTPTTTGFNVQFNRPANLNVLNLYNGPSVQYGAPDVTLTGPNGPVTGSLVWNASTDTASFIQTGSILAPGNYTATLVSGINSWEDTNNNTLQGNDPSGNYITTFTVGAPNDILSLPYFARGPGQAINIPATSSSGIPITLSNGTGVDAVDFDLTYNPALMTITNLVGGPNFPGSGWTITANNTVPGDLQVTVSGTSDLASGSQGLLDIIAHVPSTATYGMGEELSITNLVINGGAIAGTTDSVAAKVAFIGDAAGLGFYDPYSSYLISNVVVHSSSGFDAYPLIDPVIAGNVTGSGSLSGQDAADVAQESVGLNVPQIPAIPGGFTHGPPVGPGVDPLVSIPSDILGAPGSSITVPIDIDDATQLDSALFTIGYNPADLTLTGATAGTLDAGWSVTEANNKVAIFNSGITPPPAGSGSIVDLTFTVLANASLGVTPVTIASGDLNGGLLTMTTAPGSVLVHAPVTLSDNIDYVRLDSNDQDIDIWHNATASGAPAESIELDGIDSLSYAGPAGGDLFILDLSNGQPLPASGLSFTGGSGQNTLEVIGTTGNDNATVNASSFNVTSPDGTDSISYTSANAIIFDGDASGADTLTQAAQPGGGATLAFSRPTAQDTLNVNAGTFTVPASPPGAGNLDYTLGTATIATGAKLVLSQSDVLADQTIFTVNTLSDSGTMDITNNTVYVDYGNGNPSPISTIKSLITTGYSGGSWTGTGITSSTVAVQSPNSYGIGYADGGDGIVHGLLPGQIEITPALLGDANLDGKVNYHDSQIFSSNFNGVNTSWDQADFNYANSTSYIDFQLLSANNGSISSLVATAQHPAVLVSDAVVQPETSTASSTAPASPADEESTPAVAAADASGNGETLFSTQPIAASWITAPDALLGSMDQALAAMLL